MFMAVNKFKQRNDMQGHYVGDLLLIEVARRIHRCLRAVEVGAYLCRILW
ncbi:MAG: GGDEF domain-containing protein [Oleiphilaceae bacterium]|jgi:GGDEF domain-containing protein